MRSSKRILSAKTMQVRLPRLVKLVLNPLAQLDCLQALLAELDSKAGSIASDPSEFLTRQRLGEASRQLHSRYSANLVGLYCKVRQCLQTEQVRSSVISYCS